MPWVLASLLAAVFLGGYDLCAKHAVRANAVLPVIFLSSTCMAAVWGFVLLIGRADSGLLPAALVVTPLSAFQHLQIFAKSAIVTASWIFTYFAVKHLPVSIAAPIRASQPIGILAGAVCFLAERPSGLQMLGVIVTLGSFLALSLAGRTEGIRLWRDRWVGYLVIGTALGAVSGLYDKYLLGRADFTVPTVQAWFSLYLAVLFLPLAIGWQRRWWPRQDFHWRWSIPAIAGFLLLSDYLYFSALRHPDALIALVSSLRRGSVLVTYAGGLVFFGELNSLAKLLAVLGVLAGILLTIGG